MINNNNSFKQSIETMPGHEVLAMAGKTVLRPGGRKAAYQLFKWANFKKNKALLCPGQKLKSAKFWAFQSHKFPGKHQKLSGRIIS